MKYKTSELEGVSLDAAVAKALGYVYLDGQKIAPPHSPSPSERARLLMSPALTIDDYSEWFEPSGCWALGGPIIERERIDISSPDEWTDDLRWYAGIYESKTLSGTRMMFEQRGETPLIAAMRAFVASKLGDEVEL